jgi:DMSO/TMAO reductase YedYZ molybdopterin-dependent catalytic subunit
MANIPPADFKPVQLHLWASILAVPLIAAHLGSHLLETTRGLAQERRQLKAQEHLSPESARRVMTRRAFVTTVFASGLGLALAYQNTPLVNQEVAGLFIGRIPKEERGGPGDFPVETLFGKRDVDPAGWRLRIQGAVGRETELSYSDLLSLPAVTRKVRISCVSGWTAQPTWSGPLVRDILALVDADPEAKSVNLHSVSGYSFTWHARRLRGDDALLATHVNGAPLSNNHGFPVRLIVPGYPGQNMVKQIDRITVIEEHKKTNPKFKLVRASGADTACVRSRTQEV